MDPALPLEQQASHSCSSNHEQMPEQGRCPASLPNSLLLPLQVQDAHVLVPTTGVVSAASIAAAKDLQLIVQPASGGLPCMISMHSGMRQSNI